MQPKLTEFLGDPSVAAAASQDNIISLLTNPKLAGIASDPAVQEEFKSFALENALDYALQEKSPSPVPTP